MTLVAIKGEKAPAELAQQYGLHANQIAAWKAQLAERAAGVDGAEAAGTEAVPAMDLNMVHAKIGELARENDFCSVQSSTPGGHFQH